MQHLIKIGIIGGTGLNKTELFDNATEKSVSTVYGEPSDMLREGYIHGVPCVLLYRHGKQHNISPSNVNYRANIYALKQIGCTHILAVTSCGGLQEHTKPGDFVIVDQFFDNTRLRKQTFYDDQHSSLKGVLHIPMNEPFCEKTRQILIDSISQLGGRVHKSGTVVTIEGPRFSSKFESKYWNRMGASVINMTTVPEVILAKELGLCYAAIAMVTDYDSWLDSEESVDVAKVMEIVRSNVNFVRKVVIDAVQRIVKEDWNEVLKRNNHVILNSLVG